ncbi:phage tail tape measure protein [Mycobacteroides abscessus]|uniref:phage tail tape measure protein n=1 Tax=Mycobacteroides abscessus TaxID=36809 RepID=UPI00092B8CFD|nr:phage tail tape measure protein [Mycobacteroides abscessus]DAZ90353.1 TPA_asm: tape measure protein [Mycobacterium phage prophiFSQJ01-1]SII41488.1 Putative phage tail tape measure protein TMP [Mycobacteroides abscessus subsp. abscessus]SIK13681.1 Putative phage tail tape measure protein TMP [Mycobacteroides abscessus subsp. abscessus]SIN25667.1 Putative phage tail tape measure protein TMP [Mycobacteroides abscessus subsp. abscessus]SLI51244.1 Putative phage tail tape measure protein TMP [My
MAKGVELAVGYVSLVAETKDLQKGVTRALNAAGDDADSVGRKIGAKMGQGASSSFGDFMKKGLATAGIAGGLASITAGFTAAVQSGLEFERNLNTMKGVSSATAEEMAQISAKARDLGRDVTLSGTSAQSAAAAMTELVKGGLSVQQAMEAARGTVQLAAAAQVDAATAATIQARTLQTFHLDATRAADAADVLANTANASTGEIGDFAYGMQAGGAVAAQFGLTMEDTAAALGLFANNGIVGSDAGTMLKSALLALTDSGKPAVKAMEMLNLHLYDAKGNFVGVRELIQQVAQAAKDMTPEEFQGNAATLFGSDAMRFAGVAAKEGAEGFDKMRTAVTRQGGAAQLAAAQNEGLPGVFERLTNTLDDAKLALADVLNGPLQSLGNWANQNLGDLLDALKGESSSGVFSDIAKSIKDAWPDIQKFGKALASVLGTMGSAAWSAFALSLKAVGAVASVLAPVLGAVADALDGQEGAVMGVAVAWATWKFLPGMLDRLPGPLGNIRQTLPGVISGMRGFREEMQLQRSLAQMQGIHLNTVNSAMATMAARYPALAQMGAAYRSGFDGADRFQRTAGIAAGATKGLSIAAGGLVSALGGPWGLALGGASIALGLLAQKHQEAADKAAQQRQEEEALRATLDKSTGKITEQTREEIAKKFQDIGTDQRAKSYGLDPAQLMDAATGLGDPNAYNNIRKRAADIIGEQTADKGFRTRSAMIDLKNAGISNEELVAALLREGNAWDEVNKKLTDYQNNQKSLDKNYQKGVDGLQGFIDIMPDARESFITLTQNVNDQRNSIGDLSQKNRDLQQMLRGTWEATDEGIARFKDLGASIVAVPSDKEIVVNALTDKAQQTLKDLGYQVQKMPDGSFKVTADTEEAQRRIAELVKKVEQPHSMPIDAAPKTLLNNVAQATPEPNSVATPAPAGPQNPLDLLIPKRADGGAVYGEGSAKSDSVLMWGSNGEHMLTAKDVQNMGGHRGVMALRQAAAQGMLPGFKDGGPVDLEDLFGGQLPAGLADETGMQNKTILMNRALSLLFGDRIQRMGGVRPDSMPFHPSGRALDIMIPNWNTPEGKQLGDEIRQHLLENASAYGLEDVIWQQNWTGAGGQSSMMGDRGSPTQNHMDHVHATSIGGGKPRKNSKYVLPEKVQRQLLAQLMANGGDPTGVSASGLMAQIMGNGGVPTNSGVGRPKSGGMDGRGTDRTEGYIPAAAGSTGQAGTSFAAGLLNMGAEAVNGLIDQAASAAATAASAAATAGSFGAGGQAAGPAAAFAIGLGANAAKRGVSYGFQMAGIGVDALVEQLFPFGAPRWLGYDYTGFVPHLQNQEAATTTLEKAQAQQSAVNPNTKEHGKGGGAAPGPKLPGDPVQPDQIPGGGGEMAQPVAQPGGLPGVGGGQGPLPAPPASANPFSATTTPTPTSAGPAPQQPNSPMGPEWMRMMGIFDSGGMLPPGGMAINLSKSPEPVLTGRQWSDISTAAARQPLDPAALQGNDFSVRMENVNVKDVNELMGQIESKQKLQMMRYAGRP